MDGSFSGGDRWRREVEFFGVSGLKGDFSVTTLEFLQNYERQTNKHHFDSLSPLIAEDAIFWFGDGSYVGKEAIRKAFEATWTLIKEEVYHLQGVKCLGESSTVAAFVYTYHWKGIIDGRQWEGSGRGTSVLRKVPGDWQVVHEHLSKFPPHLQG